MGINVPDNQTPNFISTDRDLSKVQNQIHNNQLNMANCESLHRTSNRQKKAPITGRKDFLWQLQL
jgi:hypothetical protein